MYLKKDPIITIPFLPQMEKKLHGLVTGVISGDRLVIQGKEKEGEVPPSKELYLAFIEAPKMPTPQRGADPFAFVAREFLRKLLIGKRVSFLLEYKREDKDYGTVWLDDPESGKSIDIPAELVKQGLAKAFIQAEEKRELGEGRYQTLKAMQEEPKKEEKGIWSQDPEVKAKNTYSIVYPGAAGYDPEKILTAVLKEGGKTEGIVEYVYSSTLFSVLLVKYRTVVKISLEYLLSLPGGAKGTEQQQKLNKRAKLFAERLIQQKDVTVTMGKYDASNALIQGKITSKDGTDIAGELLANGYARLMIQTPDMDAKYYTKLRVAMNQAQVSHKGFWKETPLKAEEEKGEDKGKYTARVIEINSGDSLTVAKIGSDDEKRVFLAGIKAPKLPPPTAPEKSQPYAWEAKEHLRKLLIGKQVEVEVEYTKIPKAEGEQPPGAPAKKPMTFVNVVLPDGRCANVEMLETGLATVVTPRTDEKLTRYYEKMNEAANKAKAAKKGIHAVGVKPPLHSYQDLIGIQNPKTLAYYQDLFAKNSHVTGIVEHCFSGSRVKVRVDETNCYIPFICQGLQPLPQDPNIPELQTIFKQGQKFAREMLMQRDVKLNILSSDRKGNFFGILTVGGKNYVLSLLEEGLAAINRTPGRGPTINKELYEDAEEKAKKEKKGIWNPKVHVSLELVLPSEGGFEPVEGKSKVEIVTFVNRRFFYAIHIDETLVKKVEDYIEKVFNPAKAEKLLAPIRPGTYCMAIFSEDKKWYRAQIERVISDKACEVLFIDYGNVETVNISDTRKIDAKIIKDYPPRAFKLGLAYLELPKLEAEVGGKRLKDTLINQLEAREVIAMYKYKEGGVKYAIILEGEEADPMKSFNVYLLKRGLAKVTRWVKLPEGLKEWQDIQDKARADQIGFWETDELGENSDTEFQIIYFH
eukprot:TRINITY_DN35190_c0_g1_i1.p2 TRINITY_DN35190_c0_g1~~TRINITY_DN35190_c0_g1_i1.p2  ORF type:complete len:919 (-),score=143.15 TRINITY_DN35190_c0_g1_i1:10592-13348(-)